MLRFLHLDHVVLNVADVDRALAFYSNALGLPAERLAEFRRGAVKFPSVRINDRTIVDLFPPAMHGDVDADRGNLNHLCLVTDAAPDDIRAHLDAIGAVIEQGPVEGFGAQGTGTSYYTRDPDGNVLEIRTYRK